MKKATLESQVCVVRLMVALTIRESTRQPCATMCWLHMADQRQFE